MLSLAKSFDAEGGLRKEQISHHLVNRERSVSPTLKFQSEIAPALVDTQLEDDSMEDPPESRKRTEREGAKNSPTKKKLKVPVELEVRGGMKGPGGKLIVDAGGDGTCGWRALAYCLAECNAKPNESFSDKLDAMAEALRVLAVQHLLTRATSND